MKNREIVSNQQRLDNLFKQISALPPNPEIQSQWAKYLCVLVSGFIETSVCAIYEEYARKTASPFVANYVAEQLKYFQTPKMEGILNLTRAFNPKWEEKLRADTLGELKAAVDSIVANRNQIAHGEYSPITYAVIQEYYQKAIKVIELIEKQCNP